MKNKIVEAALAQFLEHGIRSMNMKKLVELMGISTKTAYKYFKSKEELLAECLRLLYAEYYFEFKAILGSNDNPVSILLTLFRSTLSKDFGMSREFFHDLNYYYPELQNAAINNTKEGYATLMLPLIQKGINEGYFNGYLQPEIVLSGIVTLYSSITRSVTYRDFEGSPHELFKNLVEVYIRGMCTEKGLKEIESNPHHNS